MRYETEESNVREVTLVVLLCILDEYSRRCNVREFTCVEVEEVTLYNKGRCTQTEIEVKLVSEELCSCGKSNGRSVNSVCIYCLLIGYIEVNLGNVICCELDVIVEYDTGNYSVKKSVLGLDVGPLCLIVVNNCKLPSLVYIVSVDNVCLKYNGVEG